MNPAWTVLDGKHGMLSGVSKLDDGGLPVIYADPHRGEVEFEGEVFSPAEARAFAAALVEAASIAEGVSR